MLNRYCVFPEIDAMMQSKRNIFFIIVSVY